MQVHHPDDDPVAGERVEISALPPLEQLQKLFGDAGFHVEGIQETSLGGDKQTAKFIIMKKGLMTLYLLREDYTAGKIYYYAGYSSIAQKEALQELTRIIKDSGNFKLAMKPELGHYHLPIHGTIHELLMYKIMTLDDATRLE